MTGLEYLAAIKHVGLNQSESGVFFGAHEQTGRRWAASGPPGSVAMLLKLMIRLEYTPDQIRKLIDGA